MTPLVLFLADYYFSAHRDVYGRQRYPEKITIIENENLPNLWLDCVPRSEKKIRQLLIAVEPAVLLLQTVGVEVLQVAVTETGGPVFGFERNGMNAFTTDGLNGFPIAHYTEEGVEGLPLGDMSLESVEGWQNRVTVALQCATRGAPMGAASALSENSSENLQFSGGSGFVYLYPEKGADFDELLANIADEMGSIPISPPDGSIRKQLIDAIMGAIATPEGSDENTTIDPVAYWGLGIVYDPRTWIFPNLYLEDLQSMKERVLELSDVGLNIWQFVNQTKADLRKFLEHESAGFADINGRKRLETVPIADLVFLADNYPCYSQSESLLEESVYDNRWNEKKAVKAILRAVNSRQSFVDREYTSDTPKRIAYGDIKRYNYTEFLMFLYRQGALAFQGLSDDIGVGLQLPQQRVSQEDYNFRKQRLSNPANSEEGGRTVSETTRQMVGVNALQSPNMQKIQLDLMTVWENFYFNPVQASATLESVADQLRPFTKTGDDMQAGINAIQAMDRWAGQTHTLMAVELATQAVEAIDALRNNWETQQAMEEYWRDQSILLPVDLTDLWLCFQFIGSALVALDPTYVVGGTFDHRDIDDAFLAGFQTGLNDVGVGEKASELLNHHMEMASTSPFWGQAFSIGLQVGAGQHLLKLLTDLAGFASAPIESITRMMADIKLLFASDQELLWTALGKAAAEAGLKSADKILAEKIWYNHAYTVGHMLGPLVMEIILEMLLEYYVFAPILRASGAALRTAIAASGEAFDALKTSARGIRVGAGFSPDFPDVDVVNARLLLDSSPIDGPPTSLLKSNINPDALGSLSDNDFISRLFLPELANQLEMLMPPGSPVRRVFRESLETDGAAFLRGLDLMLTPGGQ